MERMLERKPLHAAEKREKPATVCVTGAWIRCHGSEAEASEGNLPPPPSARLLRADAANAAACRISTARRSATAGGTSYIGCSVVARLLAAGHTVHATCRSPSAAKQIVSALDALPGAAQRLRWFTADLTDEGSFDEAIAGCK